MAESRSINAASLDAMKYTHIEQCIAGPGVCLNTGSVTLYEGCTCIGNCVRDLCVCAHAYDQTGLLKIEYFSAHSKPVFECNTCCSCPATCQNRSSQKPPIPTLQIFQAGRKNFGLRSLRAVAKGTYVGEYVGEIISTSEAKRRLEALSQSESCFIVTYRENTGSGSVLTTSVDATHSGNTTRFINHSCDPNLTMVPVRIDSLVPRLCLFACRDVCPGEELCFSYFGYSSEDLPDSGCVRLGKKDCLCGSERCLGKLPLEV